MKVNGGIVGWCVRFLTGGLCTNANPPIHHSTTHQSTFLETPPSTTA